MFSNIVRRFAEKKAFPNGIWEREKQAQKEAKKLAESHLRKKASVLLNILANNPFQTPPPYEKLVGDLEGAYSRRINIQHRLAR